MRQRPLLIDGSRIRDWQTFHAVFSEALNFPSFYGRNMNAWIDCMTYLDLEDGMSQIILADDEELTLRISDSEGLRERCPEQYRALVDGVAFVNERRGGLRPVLNLELER